jgi:hypothetical protein
MIFKYILYFVVCILIGLFVFIKVKFRFWASQPVFHIYNLYYWLFPPGIVQHDIPPITKFYDHKIYLDSYTNLSTEKKELMYGLIKNHFLYKRDVKYNPKKKDVLDYFKSYKRKSFISLYFEYSGEYEKKTNQYNFPKRLVACMTTRPLNCYINNNKLKIGYVDFLCVHKNERKKGHAPKIIYTHYKKSREAGAEDVFLFKREGHINFIVPLTIYNAYMFDIKPFNKINLNLPNNIICKLITSGNSELLFHYLPQIKKHFSCFIIPHYTHIKLQIDKQLLIVCMLFDKEKPIGFYFFRNPQTSYDKRNSIECLCSYYDEDYENEFIQSFQNCIVLIHKKIKFQLLCIENISNNNILIKDIMKKSSTLWKVPMAYYFYNFIYRPFLSNNVFLLN